MSERKDIDAGWLVTLANVGIRRPIATLVVALLLMAGAGLYAWDMPVSTSRYDLVDQDHPFQSQMLKFFKDFGYPDSLVLVVEDGTADARHKFIDELHQKLERDPMLKGRVLSRVGPEPLAEILLPVASEHLLQVTGRQDAKPLFDGGVHGWLSVIVDRLNTQLDGGDGDDNDGEPRPPPAAMKASMEDGVARLTGMLTAFHAAVEGRDPTVAMAKMGPSDVDLSSLDSSGYLIAGSGQHLVAMFPNLPGVEADQVGPTVEHIRNLIQETKPDGIKAQLTGVPALNTDELALVKTGLWQTSLATSICIVVLLLAAFRSLRYTVLALIPLGIGIVLTLAATRMLFGGLNLITASFTSILLALGIDFGVYILSRYGEGVREGADGVAAVRGAVGRAGPAMMIGATTTVMAFLMTTTVEFTAFSQLGMATAVGLAIMVLTTFLVLPTLIVMAGKGQAIRAAELPGTQHLARFIRNQRTPLLVMALLFVGFGIVAGTRVEFNARYFDFLPQKTESAGGLMSIEANDAFSPLQASVATESIDEARALTDKLRKLESVGTVHSATDLLPPLDESRLKALKALLAQIDGVPAFDSKPPKANVVASKLRELDDGLDELLALARQREMDPAPLTKAKAQIAAILKTIDTDPKAQSRLDDLHRRLVGIMSRAYTSAKAIAERGHYLVSDLPPVFQARFASLDRTRLAVFVTPKRNIWEHVHAQEFAKQVRSVAPNATGMACSLDDHITMIKSGFSRATLWAASLVLVILLVGLRRLDDALFAMGPLAVGAGALALGMIVLGVRFDVANIVTLPLILGLGVDAGAHMMHRYRQCVDKSGVASLDVMMRGTGAAVLLASLTTASGFAMLLWSDYGGMKSLGITMTLGISGCLFGALFVVPALLVALGKAR